MAIALTEYSQDLIARLIRTGRYNNQSEVMRAGLRLLEEREFGYLRAAAATKGALLRAYRRQDSVSEQSAAKASRRRKAMFDE